MAVDLDGITAGDCGLDCESALNDLGAGANCLGQRKQAGYDRGGESHDERISRWSKECAVEFLRRSGMNVGGIMNCCLSKSWKWISILWHTSRVAFFVGNTAVYCHTNHLRPQELQLLVPTRLLHAPRQQILVVESRQDANDSKTGDLRLAG